MSEQLELPLAPIQRIVKAALPQGATVAKEVKQSLGKAAALFILYLTNTAHDIAKTQRHSTVTGEDVLAAVEELEFDMFLDPLQAYLKEFREDAAKKKQHKNALNGVEGGAAAGSAGKKRRAPSKATDSAAAAGGDAAAAAASSDDPRSPKRSKADTPVAGGSGGSNAEQHAAADDEDEAHSLSGSEANDDEGDDD